MTDKNNSDEIATLKKGLVELFKHIQKLKKELAMIKKPGDHFSQMSDELDAIIEATEQATADIMENAEKIDDTSSELKQKIKTPECVNSLNIIAESASNIIVACSFQDITGQRVTKVLRSVQYLEERINSLISMWGEQELIGLNLPNEEEKDEYKKYLNGPALKGQGVSQEDVDAMLNDKPKTESGIKSAPSVAKSPVKNIQPLPKQTNVKPDLSTKTPENAFKQDDIDALFN